MSPIRRRIIRLTDHILFGVYAGIVAVSGYIPYKRLSIAFASLLIERKQLFDGVFYASHNEDVAAAGLDPLWHYVTNGDREGRWPMPIFDPTFYANHAGIGHDKHINRLLHYGYVGRYRRVSPSPWFDTAFYLSINKDVLRAGLDPLLHFMKWGGKEGRSPSPRFDSCHYLRTNPDVVLHGENPLVHYLQFGQYENRLPAFNDRDRGNPCGASIAVIPSDNDWAAAVLQRRQKDARVDVIIPVYRNAAVTLRCIYSVLSAKQHTPFELVVINDASPDAELIAKLEALAEQGYFTLLHNSENRGFVFTANRGMSLHSERDVILLNSDTETYNDWLDRLRTIVAADPTIGTVTPLSNNGIICSYPNFRIDNPYPLELSYQDLDALAKQVNAGSLVEAPTGVGFCMYISRRCLDEVGLFDEEVFGRGYGEENDFCQRAIKKGWKNVIAGNIFIRHWGGASFQGERFQRVHSAMKKLRQRHPNYQKDISRFIAEDPVAEMRNRLDEARLSRYVRRYNVLLVTHGRGGGTERHIVEEVERLQLTGRGAFIMRPEGQGELIKITPPDVANLPNLSNFSLRDRAAAVSLLKRFPIHEVHIHQLIDYSHEATEWIAELAKELGASIKITVHDYTAVCPRVNLIDHTGRYCGEPGEQKCNFCIKKNGSEFGVVRIENWRESYRKLFSKASQIIVPDRDVALRLGIYFPDVRYSILPHEPITAAMGNVVLPRLNENARLRIVIIGAIGKIKGYEVLHACAKDAKERNLPIDFIVYGYTQDDRKMEREGVKITGRYFDEYADEGLLALEPHAIWLPYVWPETYSYTLSIALHAHRPLFAFRLGAIASRLNAINADHWLMPLQLADNPYEINDYFLSFYAQWQTKRFSSNRRVKYSGGTPKKVEIHHS